MRESHHLYGKEHQLNGRGVWLNERGIQRSLMDFGLERSPRVLSYFRKRFRRLPAALALVALAAILGQIAAQTSTPTTRESLILSIQAAARKDALSETPVPSLQDLNALYGTEALDVGLTLRDVKQIYEDAYKGARNSLPFYVRYRPTVGWLIAILLGLYVLITKVWKDTIYPHLKNYNDRLYRKYAGCKIFHQKSLNSYRQELISEYQKFKPPFSTERELDMSQVYVPLQVQGKSHEKPLDAFNVVEKQRRVMVTGTPGAGKSMLLKRYALSYAAESSKAMPEKPVPILFSLRRLNEDNRPLVDQIATVMEEKNFLKPQNFIDRSLKRGALIVLFDGLDEVNTLKRTEVVARIKDFLRQYDECWTVITCRTAVYDSEFNEVVRQTLEVQPFTDQEIQSFLYSWKTMPSGKSPEQLFGSLNDKPSIKALARNPLLLTMIVILYSDLKTFELPHSRADFYKNAADAFLNLNKYRDQQNTYLVPQKRLVLEHLALYNQDSGAAKDQDRISIDLKTIIRETEKLLPELGLRKEDAAALLQEIVDQSGLLMPIDDGTKYQFSHLTLQEYFTASALKDNSGGLLHRFRQDPSSWRETVLLWCGLDHDSTDLIRAVYQEDALTAFQCLADALKVNSSLVDEIIEHFKSSLGEGTDGEAVTRTFALVAAGPYERNHRVFSFLLDALSSGGTAQRLLAASKALAFTNKQAAANQLASMYETQPLVWEPLTQMGDLAVSVFAQQAREGKVRAIEALQRIGTPKAASALVSFLWIERAPLAAIAAKSLAILFSQDNILVHLGKQYLTYAQRTAPLYDWIWKPYEENELSAIGVIAGRMVYLLDRQTDKAIPSEGPYADARIVIPLTVAVRHRLKPADFSFRPVEHEILGRLGRKTLKQDWLEEVYEKMSSSEVGRELVKTVEMAKPDLRPRLWEVAAGPIPPTAPDWVNIRTPSTYEFQKSWHYRLIYVSVAALSLLTVYSIISGFGRPVFSVTNVVRAISLIPTAVIWIGSIIERDFLSPDELRRAFGGPYLDWASFKEDVKRPAVGDHIVKAIALILIVAILPAHLIFMSTLLHRTFTWLIVFLFWLIIGTVWFVLWRTGKSKERVSKNPLRTLADEIVSTKERQLAFQS